MRGVIIVLALLTSACVAQAPAPRSAPVAQAGLDGGALYREKCAMCHDKAGMGTGLLARRVRVAELHLRTDLNAAFVFQAARAGIGNMPAIPRGEASDPQLQAIADYLARPVQMRQ